MSLTFPARSLAHSIPKTEAHIHTHYSHGQSSVVQVVNEAVKKGLVHIAFTEHTEDHFYQNDPDWFWRYFDEIDTIRKELTGQLKISIGIEVPAVDFEGKLAAPPGILETAEFILKMSWKER